MKNPKSSVSTSDQDKNRLPSPLSSEFEYMGRLITYERPTDRKSNSLHKNLVFPSNTNKYHYQEIYEEDGTSSDEDAYDLNKPLGVIRINDRYYREIYRVPTPPPKKKRVFHRLRSPEPKIIERVFVRRPPQEIIENIIQVPPQKVRIINKEKYLRKSKPIIRTKVVHLKPHDQDQNENPTVLSYSTPGGYTQSTIPSYNMFNSQQFSNPQPIPATCYIYEPSHISQNFSPAYSRQY